MAAMDEKITGGGGGTGIDWGKYAPYIAQGAGSFLQYRAAKGAAKTQMKGATDAMAFLKNMYEQGRSDRSPYTSAGKAALGEMMKGLGLHPFADTGGPSKFGSQLLGNLQQGGRGHALRNTLGMTMTGATTGMELGGPIGAGVGAAVGGVGSLFGR